MRHQCAGTSETGLLCERTEAGEWRLHVVSVGVRSLMYIIVNFCPFCGADLKKGNVS
jgi:hypothetical protein